MQRCRPRMLICPLQLGYSVQLHHNSGSRFEVDTASHMGFGVSYSEVQRYEANAATSEETALPECQDNQLGQFAADNADHNTITLNGKNTLHTVGIIYMLTPGNFATKCLPRKAVTSENAKAAAKIDIHEWEGSNTLQINYESLQHFLQTLQVSENRNIVDEMWALSFVFKSNRPNRTGIMQLLCKGSYPGKSDIIFLSMVDMDPNNMTCVNSTLQFVSSFASRGKSNQ